MELTFLLVKMTRLTDDWPYNRHLPSCTWGFTVTSQHAHTPIIWYIVINYSIAPLVVAFYLGHLLPSLMCSEIKDSLQIRIDRVSQYAVSRQMFTERWSMGTSTSLSLRSLVIRLLCYEYVFSSPLVMFVGFFVIGLSVIINLLHLLSMTQWCQVSSFSTSPELTRLT